MSYIFTLVVKKWNAKIIIFSILQNLSTKISKIEWIPFFVVNFVVQFTHNAQTEETKRKTC